MSLRDKVRQFVVENFYVAEADRLGDDTSLIAEGHVDSTGMLEVIAYLEGEFGIAIADTEMTPANLETIGRIADFVSRKQATGPR
jgi:acyl carrier protein